MEQPFSQSFFKNGVRRPGESYHMICGSAAKCHHTYCQWLCMRLVSASYEDRTNASRELH